MPQFPNLKYSRLLSFPFSTLTKPWHFPHILGMKDQGSLSYCASCIHWNPYIHCKILMDQKIISSTKNELNMCPNIISCQWYWLASQNTSVCLVSLKDIFFSSLVKHLKMSSPFRSWSLSCLVNHSSHILFLCRKLSSVQEERMSWRVGGKKNNSLQMVSF